MLNIQNLTKVYSGSKRAVDNLSLTVQAGDLYGFIGHNGAGKSTTLRAVAGILAFEGGTITIDGHDIQKQPVAAKRITAFLPDNPDLYEFLSGIQYLTFIADMYSIPKDDREPLIKKYGDAFDLTGALGSAIASYSHGMKQKLALISAFIRTPRLLILDEPFVGLDPVASFRMKEFLHELCQSGGAVFFSTHVLEVAEKLCTKIAIIKDGRLVEAGPTADIVGKSSLESVFLELANENTGEAVPDFEGGASAQ
jgi:ABC-2 type transport system ATP-binding protein